MKMPLNPHTNRPGGYAFVDLKSAEQADKAISSLSNKVLMKRRVSVQRVAPERGRTSGREEQSERGGWGGGGGRARGRARGGGGTGHRGSDLRGKPRASSGGSAGSHRGYGY